MNNALTLPWNDRGIPFNLSLATTPCGLISRYADLHSNNTTGLLHFTRVQIGSSLSYSLFLAPHRVISDHIIRMHNYAYRQFTAFRN